MENQSKINYQYKSHMHKLNTKVQQDEKESKQKINVEQLVHEQNQIPLPKPNDKHNYCGICLAYYSDYVKHVASDRHRVAVDERDANTFYDNHQLFSDIDNLIVEYDQKHGKKVETSNPFADCFDQSAMTPTYSKLNSQNLSTLPSEMTRGGAGHFMFSQTGCIGTSFQSKPNFIIQHAKNQVSSMGGFANQTTVKNFLGKMDQNIDD